MALVPMKEILDAADAGKYGVPALNINEMLQLQAYLNAAFELKSPVILQASMGSREFTGWLSNADPNPDLGAAVTQGMINTFLGEYKAEYGYDVPVAIILDHGPNFKQCKGAIDAGFTAVMIDGSIDYDSKDAKKPSRSLEDNIRVTREVVEYAHSKDRRFPVTVEGELGTLGGIEDKTAAQKVQLTDPKEVERFVAETGVDALAVAIGTSHGAYKFKVQPELALNLVPEIYKRAGDARLVMHGSSSVPQDLVKLIDAYPVMHLTGDGTENRALTIKGLFRENKDTEPVMKEKTYSLNTMEDMMTFGRDLAYFSCMKKSMGVPMDQIQQAIQLGIRKINVDTDGRLGTTGAIRKYMADNPGTFDQRKYFEAARDALYTMAVEKIQGFGSAGKA